MTHLPFRGLTAAPFTPFHPDGAVNLEVIPAYARLLRNNGVKAAFICGTTGEGASLSTEERIAVATAWMESCDSSLRIIIHAGHTSLKEARRMAAHAREIRASAVSVLAPYFFKPADSAVLASWCAAVAEEANPLPFYFYHIPSMTGVALPVADLLARVAPLIPNFRGVKYTFEDVEDYHKCLMFEEGRFDTLFGRDELLLDGLKAGAKGAVGSTYNYAAPLYIRIMEAFTRGDLRHAQTLQDKAVSMISRCNETGVTHLAASKALMASLGVDCGPVRLPLQSITPNSLQALWKSLGEIDFDEFSCRPVI